MIKVTVVVLGVYSYQHLDLRPPVLFHLRNRCVSGHPPQVESIAVARVTKRLEHGCQYNLERCTLV